MRFPPLLAPLFAVALTTTAFTDCEHVPRNIVITGPSETQLTSEQMVTLNVETFGLDVKRIELYRGRYKVGEVRNQNYYSHAWGVTTSTRRTNKFQAFAYDTDGYTWPSMPVTYEVAIVPTRTLPPPSAGVEERCTELDANCVCSEPFNVQQAIVPGLNDPNDSAGDRQCAGGNTVETQRGGAAVPADDVGLPGSTDWVWMVDSSGTQITSVNGNTGSFSNGTVCTRIYGKFDIPDQTGNDQQRIKVLEMSGPDFPGLLQGGFWWFDDNSASYSITRWGMDQSAPSTGHLNLSDCRESWCRIEHCIGHSNGTVQGRVRYVRIDSGETMTFTSPRGSADSVTNDTVWFGNFYTQNVEAGSRTYFSHALQAQWDSDEGQWIGPAYEIEGR